MMRFLRTVLIMLSATTLSIKEQGMCDEIIEEYGHKSIEGNNKSHEQSSEDFLGSCNGNLLFGKQHADKHSLPQNFNIDLDCFNEGDEQCYPPATPENCDSKDCSSENELWQTDAAEECEKTTPGHLKEKRASHSSGTPRQECSTDLHANAIRRHLGENDDALGYLSASEELSEMTDSEEDDGFFAIELNGHEFCGLDHIIINLREGEASHEMVGQGPSDESEEDEASHREEYEDTNSQELNMMEKGSRTTQQKHATFDDPKKKRPDADSAEYCFQNGSIKKTSSKSTAHGHKSQEVSKSAKSLNLDAEQVKLLEKELADSLRHLDELDEPKAKSIPANRSENKRQEQESDEDQSQCGLDSDVENYPCQRPASFQECPTRQDQNAVLDEPFSSLNEAPYDTPRNGSYSKPPIDPLSDSVDDNEFSRDSCANYLSEKSPKHSSCASSECKGPQISVAG